MGGSIKGLMLAGGVTAGAVVVALGLGGLTSRTQAQEGPQGGAGKLRPMTSNYVYYGLLQLPSQTGNPAASDIVFNTDESLIRSHDGNKIDFAATNGGTKVTVNGASMYLCGDINTGSGGAADTNYTTSGSADALFKTPSIVVDPNGKRASRLHDLLWLAGTGPGSTDTTPDVTNGKVSGVIVPVQEDSSGAATTWAQQYVCALPLIQKYSGGTATYTTVWAQKFVGTWNF